MVEPTKLRVVSVGSGYVVPPDELLERYKGKLKHLVVIGIDLEENPICASSDNPNFALWLVEKAKKDFLV